MCVYVTVQLYESERTSNDVLRKELQQLKQELGKLRSEVEVAKAVAVANETSSRRSDALQVVRIHFYFTLVIRRTVLHDLSVLAGQCKSIADIRNIFGSKVAICVGD